MSSPSRPIVASGLRPGERRHVAVRDEHGAQPRLVRAVHIVERPVAHVDAVLRAGHADRRHRGPERLRVRLRPRDLAAVHRAVDQVDQPVAGEDPLVMGARPHRVRQHPDLDPAAAQLQQHLDRLRIGERVLVPGLEIPVDEFLGRLHPGPGEELVKGCAALLAHRDSPQMIFRRTEHGDRVGHLVVLVVGGADSAPQLVMVDGVPGRERAAPVEYHCRYGHGCSSYVASEASAEGLDDRLR